MSYRRLRRWLDSSSYATFCGNKYEPEYRLADRIGAIAGRAASLSGKQFSCFDWNRKYISSIYRDEIGSPSTPQGRAFDRRLREGFERGFFNGKKRSHIRFTHSAVKTENGRWRHFFIANCPYQVHQMLDVLIELDFQDEVRHGK